MSETALSQEQWERVRAVIGVTAEHVAAAMVRFGEAFAITAEQCAAATRRVGRLCRAWQRQSCEAVAGGSPEVSGGVVALALIEMVAGMWPEVFSDAE